MNATQERYLMSKLVLPPLTGKKSRNTITLPDVIWKDIDEIAAASEKANGETYTRNDVIEHLLRWALQEYRPGKSK